MEHRFIGIQTKASGDGGEFSSYLRTFVYDADLNEFASFCSGDPVADFASATSFCENSDFGGVYVMSSSIDDLVFDVPGYKFDPTVGNYGAVVADEYDDRASGVAAKTPNASPRP